MINKIIEFSIRNKFMIGLFIVLWIGLGIWSMQQVPVDATPDITDNQVQVITQAPNLSTEDIEQFVTYPVEKAMSNLPHVEQIRSTSRFGLSVVTVVFEDRAGTYLPRQLVAEKLIEVTDEIPTGFGKPEMGPISTGLGEIFQFTLEVEEAYQNKYSLTELRSIQDWIVSRQMALVPGVVEVNSFGGNIKEYEVAVNPDQINALHVSLTDIFEALEKNNQNTGGAYIEKNHQAYFIRGEGLAKSATDIERILVKDNNGFPLTIKDVAQVREGHAIRYGALTENGKGEAVGGMILMLKGANSQKVIHAVKDRMKQIEESLPEGISIKPFVDRSQLIAQTTGTLQTNLMEGGLIVIFILVLFLGNWRGGLIVASAIPLSLLFAFIMMNVFGVWANLMSLGAIDFGIIVDGAVIIVEATVFNLFIKRKNKSKETGENRDQIALQSAQEMMNPAFFGQLIIIIVFLPILTLGGIEGKMFRPMALTFVFAMLGAMILCLTYIPMVSALFIKTPKTPKFNLGNKVVQKVEVFYEKILRRALRHGRTILVSALVVLGLSVLVFSRLGGEFIPQLDEGDVAFHIILKPGSSLTEATQTTTKVEKLLMDQFPEIESVVSRIGVADVPTDPMPMDIADAIVSLKPKSEWTFKGSKEELVEAMKEAVSILPGVSYEFTQPIEMRFNELLTGVREDVAIKIFGEDLEILAQKAKEVERLIAGIEGIADMNVEATSGLPQISIQYNRHKIAQYGLSIREVNQMVQTAFAGQKAGVVFEGEKRFDLVVRLEEDRRSDLTDLENLFIHNTAGTAVPLKELAEIAYHSAPMQISRENTNRRTYVGINIRNRDVKSVVEDIQHKLATDLQLPAGYFIQYGGAFENYESAKKQLQIVVPIAMALIFIMIYFALKSFRETLIIYLAIPMAVIGGILALWLRGMPFSISAGIGFIVLFGVAVLNGLVLLSGLNELKAEGVSNLTERIIQGSKRRIRPIMLTALTDIFGFMPMALSTSAGAEVQRPLATVVIGGLVTATLLTLFILPILYRTIENKGGRSFLPNKSMLKPIALLSVALLCCWPAKAQELPAEKEISMEEAVRLAHENYFLLKNKDLEIDRQKALHAKTWDLGETELFTGGEEIKSGTGIYTLVGIGQQNIAVFGTSARKEMKEAALHQAEAEKMVALGNLDKQVKMAWTKAYIERQEYRLLVKLDSLYAEFEQIAALHYKTESISKLAYNEAKKERMQMLMQKDQQKLDYAMAEEELNIWLGGSSHYKVGNMLPLLPDLEVQQSNFANHPQLALIQAEMESSAARYKSVKSSYLPKLNLEYGFQKVGNENGYFSYQAGISVPLFSSKTKADKRATQLEMAQLQNELEFEQVRFTAQYRKAHREYQKWKKSYLFYLEEARPLAQQQQAGALLAYKEGAIDQTEFIQILRNSVQTEQETLKSLENYLNALYEWQYFINEHNPKN